MSALSTQSERIKFEEVKMILKTIKCKKCNKEILDTNKFCPECGEKISGNKESS